MKTTVVPAQITTVEDKIAGNLSFTQLLLLTTPVFIDGALFVLFPPVFKPTAFKLAVGIAVALLCMALAIRVKGKILLSWIAVISRYNQRPTYYLFNKNSLALRTTEPEPQEQVNEEPIIDQANASLPFFIPMPELVRAETAIADPRARFHLRAEKGGLRVYISEVKEESI